MLSGISEISQIRKEHVAFWLEKEVVEDNFIFGAICNSTSVGGILPLEPKKVDVVLHQLNYLDWDSAGIQSRACCETCMRRRKSVIVMEPVTGGTLAKLPPETEALLRQVHPDWSPADWALRFVQSLPGVEVCLSGMGILAQVQENIRPLFRVSREGMR